MEQTTPPPREAVHLPLLTTSRVSSYRTCSRMHDLAYNRGIRSIRLDDARRFGTLMHLGLELLWLMLLPSDTLGDLLAMVWPEEDYRRLAMDAGPQQLDPIDGTPMDPPLAAGWAALGADTSVDPFDLVKAQELLRAYWLRYRDQRLQPVLVEASATAPLINPDTGRPSTTWIQAGKLDVLAVDLDTGEHVIVEHKTTVEDLTPGSPYWLRLKMDGQVSTYFDLAEALGFPATGGCEYDAIGKPSLKPAKATPEEKRAYTAAKWKQCPSCKAKGATPGPHVGEWIGECQPDPEGGKRRVCTDEGGKLYANMRDRDETPEEYRARLRADVAEQPGAYLQRQRQVRLPGELDDHRRDLWADGRRMRDAQLQDRHPRNPGACKTWGRMCDFFDACTGVASLDDRTKFTQSQQLHPELPAEIQTGTTASTEAR